MSNLRVINNNNWSIYKIIDKTLYVCNSAGTQKSFDFNYLHCNWYDLWWIFELLPTEGVGSSRDFALFAAQQVQHFATDSRVAACLDVVSKRIQDPQSVSDAELEQARKGAWAAYVAAHDAYAAYAAATAAAYTAAYAAADAAYAAADAAATAAYAAADAAAYAAADAAATAAYAAADAAAYARAAADAAYAAAANAATRNSINNKLLNKLFELLINNK